MRARPERDEAGPGHEGRPPLNRRTEFSRRGMRRAVQPGMEVLDVGCGPGRFAVEMLRTGARVTLADVSP